MQMIGMLYAILIVLLGLIFAVTEALIDVWLQLGVVAVRITFHIFIKTGHEFIYNYRSCMYHTAKFM